MACVGGCGSQESAVHFILRSNIFSMLWHLIYKWVVISFLSPDSVVDHFHQFDRLAGFPRHVHSYFQVIWNTIVWVIWKERNYRIFKNNAQDLFKLLDAVKFLSFSWLKAKLLTSSFDYNDGWRSPLLCMGVSFLLLVFSLRFMATDT